MFESELFGHKKGAFTGAIGDKEGLIGRSNGGSLLLDEIGELPMELQPKLLRVLQERIYYRVGSEKPLDADFRLICSTNRRPFDAIEDGKLREDLYYRINTIEITIPSLRERMEDVPMLAEYFLDLYSQKYKRDGVKFSENAYQQMLNYDWRGNVRELENVIERAVLLSKDGKIEHLNIPNNFDSTISLADIQTGNKVVLASGNQTFSEANNNGFHLPANLSSEEMFDTVGKYIVENLPEPKDGEQMKDVFNLIESVVVVSALKRTKGNKQAAANLLGLYRPRLYGMIKRHNLEEKI